MRAKPEVFIPQSAQKTCVNGTVRPSFLIMGLIFVVAASIGLAFGTHWTLDRKDKGTSLGATSVPIIGSDHNDRRLQELWELPTAEFESLDIVELNLAIARELPECRCLNVAQYRATVDEWATWVKHEIDRHSYRFEANPSAYKNSRAYFCALMMCTVVGQDFQVAYDRDAFSFSKPEDQLIYGLIDKRRGTCISMPLLYIAIGQRLKYPIKAVAIPGHTFCRWEDPVTGERVNIEATSGGLVDHDDEYYRHWPYEIEARWEKEHHMLKSLTMRQHASVMMGSLGAYYAAKGDLPAALRWDALAHWLDPDSRTAFVLLRGSIDAMSSKYLDADELAGRKSYLVLEPHRSVAKSVGK